ncbi:MAG: hypothetical protein ACE15B_19340 [Bryobacteraceae bacterium]
MDQADRLFYILEKTREIGQITGPMLTAMPDWNNRAKVCRDLKKLVELGWLQRANPGRGVPVYILGPKAFALAVDVGRIA